MLFSVSLVSYHLLPMEYRFCVWPAGVETVWAVVNAFSKNFLDGGQMNSCGICTETCWKFQAGLDLNEQCGTGAIVSYKVIDILCCNIPIGLILCIQFCSMLFHAILLINSILFGSAVFLCYILLALN